jgi:hypothetical protein
VTLVLYFRHRSSLHHHLFQGTFLLACFVLKDYRTIVTSVVQHGLHWKFSLYSELFADWSVQGHVQRGLQQQGKFASQERGVTVAYQGIYPACCVQTYPGTSWAACRENTPRKLGAAHFRTEQDPWDIFVLRLQIPFLVASSVLGEPTRQVDSLAVGSVRVNGEGSEAARTSSSATVHFENTDSLSVRDLHPY